ncbi:hypothetical protein O6P43_009510 [Quillaja saponaria]|uniref:Uncharacterized protein n=1 Tax=Quillaja saponaria TaxID=32244 RepID=A0AAD7VD97_QUISA|nr:hypothetical protein O6P43_009510 [Quillaja saponaria]
MNVKVEYLYQCQQQGYALLCFGRVVRSCCGQATAARASSFQAVDQPLLCSSFQVQIILLRPVSGLWHLCSVSALLWLFSFQETAVERYIGLPADFAAARSSLSPAKTRCTSES